MNCHLSQPHKNELFSLTKYSSFLEIMSFIKIYSFMEFFLIQIFLESLSFYLQHCSCKILNPHGSLFIIFFISKFIQSSLSQIYENFH